MWLAALLVVMVQAEAEVTAALEQALACHELEVSAVSSTKAAAGRVGQRASVWLWRAVGVVCGCGEAPRTVQQVQRGGSFVVVVLSVIVGHPFDWRRVVADCQLFHGFGC